MRQTQQIHIDTALDVATRSAGAVSAVVDWGTAHEALIVTRRNPAGAGSLDVEVRHSDASNTLFASATKFGPEAKFVDITSASTSAAFAINRQADVGRYLHILLTTADADVISAVDAYMTTHQVDPADEDRGFDHWMHVV